MPKPPPRESTTRIANLLALELVLPSLAARTMAEVLDTMATHVARAYPHVDARRLANALHEREQQSTTALENGVAIPHVRLPGLPAPLAALARSPAGVRCEAADGRSTQVFLLLVVAAEQPGSHLRLLASAARLLSDARCRSRLLAVASAEDILAVLRDEEQRAPRGARAA